MERQIEDISEKGSNLENSRPLSNQNAHSNAIQDSKISRVVSQGEEQTTAIQHPYCQLHAMLGDVLVMLHTAANQTTKPRCIETTKTAANYIKRIRILCRALFKAGAVDPQYPRTPCQLTRIKGYVRDVLKKAGERLTLNKSLTQFLTLHGIKETIKEPTELIAEAHGHLANFIAENPEESTRCELANGGLNK
jgi:hypothetical protein